MSVALLGVTALCGINASAQTYTSYDSAASGSWLTSTVWSPTGVPGAGPTDSVYIQDGHAINLTFSPSTVQNVTIDALWIETNGSLAVTGSGNLTVEGNLQYSNGLWNDGLMTVTDSNVNARYFTNAGQLSLKNSTVTSGSFHSYGGWDYVNNKPNTAAVTTLDNSHIKLGGGNSMTSTQAVIGDTLNLLNGSTIDASLPNGYGNIIFDAYDSGYQINVGGEGNKIVADYISVDFDSNESIPNSRLNIQGVDNNAVKNVISIDGYLEFTDEDNQYQTYYTGTLALNDVTASLSEKVYDGLAAAGTAALEFGIGTDSQNVIITGNGSSAIDFVFNAGSGIAPGNSGTGEFAGKSFTFNGSTIYVEVGSSAYDKIVSEGNIDFLGSSNIILMNRDNTDNNFDINLSGMFVSKTGDVKIGTENLADTDIAKAADKNEIDVQGSGTNKITIQSAIRGGKDQFVFDDVENKSGVIVVKATGQETEGSDDTINPGGNPNEPNQNSGQSNLSILNNIVWGQMTPGQLQAAIASYAGADLDKRDAATLQLDPAVLSVAAAQSLDAVRNFITAGNSRSLDRLGANCRNSQSCDPCSAVFGGNGSRELWFQALGGWQNQQTTGVEGYTADTYGFALGVDKKINADTLLGIGFGGEFSNAKSKTRNSSSKADTLLVEVYGSHRIGSLFLSAAGGYAGSDVKSNRSAPLIGGFAQGKHDADSYFGNIEFAYRLGNKQSYLTPYLSYDFIRYEEDAFRENGNIALNVAERNLNAYFQTLGVRLGQQFKNRQGRLVTPEVSFGWLHDYGSGDLHTTGSFVAGSPAFTVLGVSRNKNRGVIGASLTAELSKRSSVFFRYDGEFADNYNGQYLSGGMNVTF